MSLSGQLSATVSPYIWFRFHEGELHYARLTITPSAELSMSATANGSFMLGRDVVSKNLAPLPSPIPWLVIVPKIDVSLTLSGGAMFMVGAAYTFTNTWGAECRIPCDGLSDWRRVRSTGPLTPGAGLTMTTDSRAEGSLQVAVPGRFTFNFYGVAGPFIEITPYVEGRAILDADAECLQGEIKSGLGGAVGIDLANLIDTPGTTLSGNILSPSTLWVGELGPCVPGRPTQLDLETVWGDDSVSELLTWNAPEETGGSPIIGYQIEFSNQRTPSNWIVLASNTGSPTTRYWHRNLPFGVWRHYRVSAINEYGVGEPSSTRGGCSSVCGAEVPGSWPTQIALSELIASRRK